MTDMDRLLIERACERLVQQYCHFVDHGEAARIAELFTDDGVWTSPDNTMTGNAAIREGFMQRQKRIRRRSRHVCTNQLINVIDEQTAEGTVYLTLYRHDDEALADIRPAEAPVVVGAYHDRFVRTEAGWRIHHRAIHVDFARR